MIASETALILAMAFLIDFLAGDPPNRFHPVAWMGNGISWYQRRANRAGNARRFLSGLVLLVVGLVLMVGIGWLIQRACQKCPSVVSILVQAVVLKCTFSARSLMRAAKRVANALDSENISLARQQVAFHLVSRDTSGLGDADLSAATIESVAENSSDSIIAPLFYFALAGLPGALAYRFVNTCDAMLGYRIADLEWFGKPAARLDDLLNLVPARLTALIMLGVGAGMGTTCGLRRAVNVWWQDHALTASPNAGHPMSAAAGILGVMLEKQGHYRLGEGLPPPSTVTIVRSIHLLWGTATCGVLLLGIVAWLVEVYVGPIR
jgi:adenosylcobinamide-phosphate synthase